MCELCCEGADVPCHILFHCNVLNPERLVYWQKLMNQMPLAMSGEVRNLPYLIFMNGIVDFISVMYKKQHELYDKETATVY